MQTSLRGRWQVAHRIAWMMVLLVIALSGTLIAAQDAPIPQPTDPDEEFSTGVFVDSAFIRAAPTRDAEPVASVFENAVLTALGRNSDGTWFEVRRPRTDTPIGWISTEVIAYTFEVARLPITDLTTGVTGAEPVFDTGISVFFFAEAALRADPEQGDNRVGIVPRGVTLPVIARSPENLWLFVNYNGQVGWVAEFLTTTSADLDDIPIAARFLDRLDENVSLPVIPPEVQLAQVNRLRAYITPLLDISTIVANFWGLVRTGEVVPCEPPSPGGFAEFSITQQDLFELPELRRYRDRLNRATADLNATLVTMNICGVYSAEEVSRAYAQAVNATIIFEVTLDALDDLEEFVILQP